jgi:hypothetical protein
LSGTWQSIRSYGNSPGAPMIFHNVSKPVLFAASAAVLICGLVFAQTKTNSRAERGTAPQQKTHKPAATAPAAVPVPTPAQWVHKKFVVLKKQKLFRKFGYELYLTKELSLNPSKIDTSQETDKHHVRCDKLAGTSLVVSAVEPAAGEYLVTFTGEDGGRTLYAKTHKGAIEGIAAVEDLDSAARKWVGKTVYSRRRFIDTYDSVTGAYGTVKVRIQDRLKVTSAVWGLSPLPPKPVWLLVETAAGVRGFIPVRASWTNVMTDKVTADMPWTEDIFETNPADLYAWDSLTWSAINSHTVSSGMSKEQVLVSWGRPMSMVVDTVKASCPEQWVYGGQVLCFSRDTVIAVGAR